MSNASQVVIVGGGAAGCAAAWHLAREGVDVTIVEREGIGTQASGYSAGGLNPLQGAGIPGPLGPLAIESYRMHLASWEELRADSGVDFHAQVISMVHVALAESELPGLRETLDIFQKAPQGFSAHWLDARDVRELEPRIAPGVIAGLYMYGNAALDSYLYTLALSRAAQRRGARLRPGQVTGLRRAGGRVGGVLLSDGEVACDAVVLAMGPWSREAEPWLGVPVPVEPLKGEILRMALPGPALAHDFGAGGVSLFHRADGLVWCGATEERRGFDRQPSESAKQRLLDGAIRLMPSMAQARLVKHTACLRPVTPDWLPIIGRAPGWDNAYLATGAGKKGILIAPGIGKAVADLVTDGKTDLPIAPFAPQRFAAAGG